MRRSFIDRTIEAGIEFCRRQNVHLPRWATWDPRRWASVGPEADEVRRRMLGWDVTDFGGGDFDAVGLLLFTVRNGELVDPPDPSVKDYCQKLLWIGEGQVTPMHFHWAKMEDIINRAGGRLVLELYRAGPEDEALDESTPVEVSVDGIVREVPPGGTVVLDPGESITLAPYVYHRFYAEKGGGMVLGGEVSRVNDDARDNRFLEPLPRFPAIEEDAPARYVLCTEYPPAP